MFSKSVDNVNTKIILKTEFGPMTVHLADDQLGRPVSEVYDMVNNLLDGAKSLSDAFGIDIMAALAKNDFISLDSSEPETPAEVGGKITQSSPSQSAVNVPVKRPVQQLRVPSNRPAERLAVVNESVEADGVQPQTFRQLDVEKVVVTSPNGRNFEIPTKIIDETGDTTIAIDVNSKSNYDRINSRIENNSFKDGYNVQFSPCKLCYDRKTNTSTGKTNGKTCPKCSGSGEILVG